MTGLCLCGTKDSTGRFKLYQGTLSGTVQYFTIGANLCSLSKCPSFLAVVVGSSGTSTNTVALTTCCGGVLPLVASSTMASLTLAEASSGTVLQIAVVSISGIPTGVVLNR